LDTFERIRRYLGVSAELADEASADDEPPAEVDPKPATELLRDYPQAGAVWMVSEQPTLQGVHQALEQAQRALKAQETDEQAYSQALREAGAELQRISQVLLRFPDADWKAPIQREVDALIGRLDRIGLAQEINDAERNFQLGEAQRQMRALLGRVEGLAQSLAQEEGRRFRGGPEGLWYSTSPWLQEAKRAQQRLLGQYELADQSALIGMLAVFEDQPEPSRYHEGFAWSSLLRRLVYSDLYGGRGSVGIVDPTQGLGDPHLRWLQGQIEKALENRDLEGYKEATRIYLESVRDFLRY
jgi:chaperonin cofactor prefoldin